MMGLQWVLLVCHRVVNLFVVISFYCGQWPIFEHTFIQRLHIFLTFDAFDYFRRFVEYVFGSKGSHALYSIQYHCCDRPNPILQLIYLAIIGGIYCLVVYTTFNYIPGHYLGGYHIYTSLAAVGVGLLACYFFF